MSFHKILTTGSFYYCYGRQKRWREWAMTEMNRERERDKARATGKRRGGWQKAISNGCESSVLSPSSPRSQLQRSINSHYLLKAILKTDKMGETRRANITVRPHTHTEADLWSGPLPWCWGLCFHCRLLLSFTRRAWCRWRPSSCLLPLPRWHIHNSATCSRRWSLAASLHHTSRQLLSVAAWGFFKCFYSVSNDIRCTASAGPCPSTQKVEAENPAWAGLHPSLSLL